MATSERDDDQAMSAIITPLLSFLRDFEQLQQDIDFRQPQAAQQHLKLAQDTHLAALPAQLAALLPAPERLAAQRQLGAAIETMIRAVARLLAGSGPDFGLAFIESRRLWCEGLALLYGLCHEFPALDRYWWSEAVQARGTPPMPAAPAPARLRRPR